ncbi:MAG TPA: gamma-glutamyltransferase family protein [Actinomycetota bacterium]|nr:gamma-glutamyltransferase family protein [Actinomycetota bacterium]
MVEARRFPEACVASPHYLASAAGLAVLASGGNAVDAAVATNLTLGVVAPYLCGFGGDLFAMVWRDGVAAYNGSGRAPVAATPEAVRAALESRRGPGGPEGSAADGPEGSAAGEPEGSGAAEGPDGSLAPRHVPLFGPLSVTVPGAPEAWFALLDRFGTRSFGDLARWALRYAREGFPVSARAAESFERARGRYAGHPWAEAWFEAYGSVRAGSELRQPELARTIELLAEDGPDAYYRGPIGEAIARCVRSLGGLLSEEDLAAHRGQWVEPLRAPYREVEVLELPPNTQGATALEALRIVEAAGPLPPDGPDRHHLLIEATKLALLDRDTHLGDPDHMRVPAERLLADDWVGERARAIGPLRASRLPPGRDLPPGTAYLCAADREGTLVSLIQSNFTGFGSGVRVPGWGINLQNRGASFTLDPSHVNAVGPRKRPLHTLIPAMALREGRPWLAFGTMGGQGQPQFQLQLLVRVVDDGEDLQRAVDAPRWLVSSEDWSVEAESRFGVRFAAELRARGHELRLAGAYESIFGHAHAIAVTPQGYLAATDPRAEGAAVGL